MLQIKLFRFNRMLARVLACGIMFLAAAAFAQQGGRERGNGGGGGWPGGGGRGHPVEQKPGKPPEERFLRVCRVLLFEKDQLKKAVILFDGMLAARDSLFADQLNGSMPAGEAGVRLEKLESGFKAEFSQLLNEEQKEKMLELQEKGTLENRWW